MGKKSLYREKLSACALCHEARCTSACPSFDPARIIRAAYFENDSGAAALLPRTLDEEQVKAAMAACPYQVDIAGILEELRTLSGAEALAERAASVNLSCDFCGFRLENPFLLSSSVVGSGYEMCARAFSMGWAGVSYKTICLMDIQEASPRFSAVAGPSGDWYGFKNIEQLSDRPLEENLAIFRRLKAEFPKKLLLVSIMGHTEEEWERLARMVTEAGADAIECNFSCPNMEARNAGSDLGQDPEAVRICTAAARRGTQLPLLAKMTPNITDMREPARAAIESGADGIAAINTLKSITGVNLATEVALPEVGSQSMIGGYSGAAVKPVALRFIADMARDEALAGCHISGMGGIRTWRDAVEFLLLGAGSLQVTTAVMEYGYRIIDDLLQGLQIYMARRDCGSIADLRGRALPSVVANECIDRHTISYPRFYRKKCTGCGRCYLSCRDGGHQAITFDPETRTVTLNPRRCVGCHLCILVCPQGAIAPSKRVEKRQTP